ncbi:hypothetical protein QBC37DRAFT_445644 [Rhypophila decipiens]|uniref:Uncharacterized protein n=1 Tax=Rhypophila decipiens TaxID=261697 RepID=A0AAN7BDV5_9PEZI|nr:hypothetical protein QBC37DRAFT_445644 [Rhypophila decipiens]
MRYGNVRMMTAAYEPVGRPSDPVFLGRLNEVWEQELKKHKTVYELEQKVQIGRNLVPWNLGPLAGVKALKRTSFAMAFALLAKRECRDASDFLWALSGIVTATPQLPFRNDVRTEIAELARGCLEAGDFSPLLTMPDLGDDGDPRAHPDYALNAGYNDVFTWELGEQINGPTFADELTFSQDRNMLTVRLEKMGRVIMVHQANGGGTTGDPMRNFSRCAAMTLELTGPSFEEFVASIGTRLYGLSYELIRQNLETTGNLAAVEDALKARYDSPGRRHDWWPIEGPQGAEWLASVLSLSSISGDEPESRLASCLGRYNTMHGREFNHVVGIICTTCLQTSPFRVCAFGPSAAALHGANAYRIPGLQYRMSIPNGMALLEKKGRIVGRMMWATPACQCADKTELVRLHLPNFPPPRPRSRYLSEDAKTAYENFEDDVAREKETDGDGD